MSSDKSPPVVAPPLNEVIHNRGQMEMYYHGGKYAATAGLGYLIGNQILMKTSKTWRNNVGFEAKFLMCAGLMYTSWYYGNKRAKGLYDTAFRAAAEHDLLYQSFSKDRRAAEASSIAAAQIAMNRMAYSPESLTAAFNPNREFVEEPAQALAEQATRKSSH
jgi:hypothetical protein